MQWGMQYSVGTQYAVGVSTKRSTHTVDLSKYGWWGPLPLVQKGQTKDMSSVYKYCVLYTNYIIHSFDLFNMTTSMKLFCGVFSLLVFFQYSASEVDVQARLERMERRMEKFETYLVSVIQITYSSGL